MAAINARLRSVEGHFFAFWCPGCKETHGVPSGRGWTWNGNTDAPTVQPSLLITSGHYVSEWKPGTACWCTYNAAHPKQRSPFACERCHTFITDGQIHFLADCTHALAGQTVPIPDWPQPTESQPRGKRRGISNLVKGVNPCSRSNAKPAARQPDARAATKRVAKKRTARTKT